MTRTGVSSWASMTCAACRRGSWPQCTRPWARPSAGRTSEAGGSATAMHLRAGGGAVAFGILLDTIVVRLLLVTALNLDVGRWMWWPSKLAQKPDPAPDELNRERAAATVPS